MHSVRNHLILPLFASVVFLSGCKSPDADSVKPANVKHVSLAIFEVVDCTTGMVPMTLKGSTEKYCLAAKPVVDETDIRRAEAGHDEVGGVRLSMYFTSKAGQRMKETTERINSEHLSSNDYGKMGIVMDGALVDVPTLRGTISDSLVISGTFNMEDAVQIADSLNAGPPSK